MEQYLDQKDGMWHLTMFINIPNIIVKNKLNFRFKSKKIWVASSTHSDEEIFCGKTHIELRKKIKNLFGMFN